jgi:PAS domain S-box-containing protein
VRRTGQGYHGGQEIGPVLNFLQKPELLSTLLAGMLDGLSIIDASGVQIYVNDALCEMVGFTRAELLGATAPYPYWPREELATIDAAFQRTLQGDSTNFELVFQRKDGTRFEVIVAPAELRDESGNVLVYFATIKDISQRKQLERSLLASEQRWRSIAENPFDFVVMIDREYRYTFVNHTAPGISRESLIGRATPFDFTDPIHHAAMRSAYETTFETGRATSYDVHVPQLDAWYSNIVGAIVEHGRVTAISILTREITEQKRAEEALRRSEQRLRDSHRMETIGTLAGGIAHDINNILTPILAYADLAQQELAPDHPIQEHLQGITLASERARELVQRILLFSRRQEPHKTNFDLRQSVREDITLLKASLPASIELVTELPAEPLYVFADRAQLGQVLTNLATNALQAMPEGGKLTIALEPAGEQTASLTVTDTGAGMDAETQRRAFDPFFTTKPLGSGTGLGLSIVHSVVREHAGEITVHSAPGQGAVFTVRLATTTSIAASAAEAALSTQTVTGRGRRVLVVDDEPAVVQVTRRALTRAGHVVTALTCPEEALQLLAQDPNAFDILLTDQSMPAMTGTTLIAEARAMCPSLACLLMTGLGDEATQRRARSLNVVEIIAKPFALSTLLLALERCA